jgi:hypothetical protein
VVTIAERRVRDPAIRIPLYQFFRPLPQGCFPALVAPGEHVWLGHRKRAFAAGLEVLVDGLSTPATPRTHRLWGPPTTTAR